MRLSSGPNVVSKGGRRVRVRDRCAVRSIEILRSFEEGGATNKECGWPLEGIQPC